jgi:hypothetical protein
LLWFIEGVGRGKAINEIGQEWQASFVGWYAAARFWRRATGATRRSLSTPDLAERTIRVAGQRATGVFNATGPAGTITMHQMLAGIAQDIQIDRHGLSLVGRTIERRGSPKIIGKTAFGAWA